MNRIANQQVRNEGGLNLEPLATYLEPRFGNIYNLDDDALIGYDVQEWTGELRDAVQQYLVHEVTDDDYAMFLDELTCEIPEGTRVEQVEFIIEHHEAWQIANAFHIAAVKAVPILAELMGEQSSTWESEDQKEDVALWLQAHATYEQLIEVAQHSGVRVHIPEHEPYQKTLVEYRVLVSDLAQLLVEGATPQELLDAWRDVVGPVPTDLTDEEWAWLEPSLPQGYKATDPAIVRQAINGMLYRYTHRHKRIRPPMPLRYGKASAVTTRLMHYRKSGVLARMLAALQDKPGAERLVAWLEEIRTEVEVTAQPWWDD